MGKLILIRGAAGAGKTTLAETFRPITDAIFSADDFFTVDGDYIFDHTQLPNAHADCLLRVTDEMIKGTNLVIVHNTFTRIWEMEKYFSAAKAHDYQVTTLVVENRHDSRSVHGVPGEVVHCHRLNLMENMVL